jgi:hypothetical protein
MIKVVPVTTDQEFKDFIDLPYSLYKDNRYWVPPLKRDVRNLLDKKHNPFWEHSEREMFLAYRGNNLAGRICAIIDHNFIDFWREKTGYFGFFECDNDEDAARALFEETKRYHYEKGMDTFIGPLNPSTNEEIGFLLDGYFSPPMIMMTYTPEYYHKLAQAAGLKKAKDYYAFYVEAQGRPLEYLERMCSIVRKRVQDLKVRPVSMADFSNEVQRIKTIYNDAWSRNWGFVPMTDAEFNHLAKNLKDFIVPELVILAEINGDPAAVSLTVPDYNFILKKLNGRLGPVEMLKFLYYRKKIKEARLMIMGVRRQYQKLGLESCMMLDTIRNCQRMGITGGELSWTLEDNYPINNTILKVGGKIYKKYRVYGCKVVNG